MRTPPRTKTKVVRKFPIATIGPITVADWSRDEAISKANDLSDKVNKLVKVNQEHGVTIAALRKSNSELMAEQKAGLVISQAQRDDYDRLVREHTILNEEVNAVTSFIRDNSKKMREGKYIGMSFSQMVIAIIKKRKGKK